jgi:transposase
MSRAVRGLAKKLECNYDRNIYTQLEETLLLVEKLRKEITELKKSHRQEMYVVRVEYEKAAKELKKFEKERREIAEFKTTYRKELYEITETHRKTVKELKKSHESKLYRLSESYSRREQEISTPYKAEIRELKEVVKVQASEIAHLKEENAALKNIVSRNSGNSSKPPSSDVFKKIQNSRKPTGKKTGGQWGHKGHQPKFYVNPNEIIDMKAKKCGCGGSAWYTEEAYKRKQLVDIEIVTKVTEYREYTGFCSCCGCTFVNRSPLKGSITYGNNLKSFSNILSAEGNVSVNRICQLLSEISGGQICLSEGTVCKWNKDLSQLLAPSIQKIKEKLLTSPVLHKDETCIRTDKKTNWLHVLSNDRYTLYYPDKKRGKDADIEAGVLPAFGGVLVHDHLLSLYHFKCVHAECNAHILRYLKGVAEANSRRWANDMIEFLLYAKQTAENSALNPADIDELYRLYDDILELGQAEFERNEKPDYNGDDMKLFRRLREYKAQHLLFLSDRNVPFDNNQAERDLRMIKAKTKISGCFRSADGDSFFAAIKSYTSSLRKNNLNIFDAIISAWQNIPILF